MKIEEIYYQYTSHLFRTKEHSLWVFFIRKSVLVFSKFWINGLKGNDLLISTLFTFNGTQGKSKKMAVYLHSHFQQMYRSAIIIKR